MKFNIKIILFVGHIIIKWQGEKKLDQLKSMVGYIDPKDTSSDEDSWLNIKDDEDPRGRVGIEWPWGKK